MFSFLVRISLFLLLLAGMTACSRSGPSDPPTLLSISITNADSPMLAGTSQQLSATGTYSDGTTRDITSVVTWSSADETIATVVHSGDSKGTVSAVQSGSATITASTDKSASVLISVLSVTWSPSAMVFAQTATIATDRIDQIDTINYVIATKPGNSSRNVNVTYSLRYLTDNGYVQSQESAIDVPVFGLYAGYLNTVTLTVTWKDATTFSADLPLQTDKQVSDNAITNIAITKKTDAPAVSYLLLDTQNAPAILDIDGETRWQFEKQSVLTGPVYVDDQGFLLGDHAGNTLYRVNYLGGVTAAYNVADPNLFHFNHDFDQGKQGILGSMISDDGVWSKVGSVLLEFDASANVLNTWDFDTIIGDILRSAGEDTSLFILNGIDWFHINSAVYSGIDDSLIVSSRENFVIALDYTTRQVKWILGNTAKLWFQDHPSLQGYALTLNGSPPIGQHALSLLNVSTDGRTKYLLLFNNGAGNQALTYIGDNRGYSSVSLYEINETAGQATEIWSFDDDQLLDSPACSSVYKTGSGDYLIDFATTASYNEARILIVDSGKNISFDMTIPKRAVDSTSCDTAYRAREIALDRMVFN